MTELISSLGVDPLIQNHDISQLDTVLNRDSQRTLVVDTRRNFPAGFLLVCRPVLAAEPGILLVSYLMLARTNPNVGVGQVDAGYTAENQLINAFKSQRIPFELRGRPLVPSVFREQPYNPLRSMVNSLFHQAWPNFSLYASPGSRQNAADARPTQETSGGPGPGPGSVSGSGLLDSMTGATPLQQQPPQPPQPGLLQSQPSGQGPGSGNSQSRLTKRFSRKGPQPQQGLDIGNKVRTRRFIPHK